MKQFVAVALSLCVVGMAQEASAAPGVNVQFKNKSQWSIEHMYLSPTSESDWGPDQLGEADSDIIQPGGSFTLTGIEPNKYDFKVIDEDGDECIVEGVKVAASETVVIDDASLLGCQAGTAATEEE